MFRSLFFFSIFILSHSANAIHLDIAVFNDNGTLKTDFCSDGLACDDLPVLTLLGLDPQETPIDTATGRNVFISDFNDFEGGPNGVDDPGYISDPGQLPADIKIKYRAVGELLYWDPNTETWSNNVPGTTRLKLAGGIDEFFSTDPVVCGGAFFCLIQQASSTFFTAAGITGPTELTVGSTNASGVLHVHLDWFIEDSNETPGGPAGAYMIEMQLINKDIETSGPFLGDSEPFYIIFAKDITSAQFGEALSARINVPESAAVPIPAVFSLILFAFISIAGARRFK